MEKNPVDRITLCAYLGKQMSRLMSTGVSEEVTKKVLSLMETFPDFVELTDKDNIPLLVVLPFEDVSFEQQLRLADLGNGPANTFLDKNQLVDLRIHGNNDPYIIYDIETGLKTLDVSADDAAKSLYASGRHPFITSQALALITHFPQVFKAHNIIVAGTRIKDRSVEMGVPPAIYAIDFYLYGGRAKMKREDPKSHDPKWGSPSYRTSSRDPK